MVKRVAERFFDGHADAGPLGGVADAEHRHAVLQAGDQGRQQVGVGADFEDAAALGHAGQQPPTRAVLVNIAEHAGGAFQHFARVPIADREPRGTAGQGGGQRVGVRVGAGGHQHRALSTDRRQLFELFAALVGGNRQLDRDQVKGP